MTDKKNQIDMSAFSDGYEQGYADGQHDEAKRSYTKKQLREMGFAFTTNGDIVTPDDMGNMAERYFEYRKKEWIENACEWLDEHWNDYFGEDGDFNGWHMMRDFRKFMEE